MQVYVCKVARRMVVGPSCVVLVSCFGVAARFIANGAEGRIEDDDDEK